MSAYRSINEPWEPINKSNREEVTRRRIESFPFHYQKPLMVAFDSYLADDRAIARRKALANRDEQELRHKTPRTVADSTKHATRDAGTQTMLPPRHEMMLQPQPGQTRREPFGINEERQNEYGTSLEPEEDSITDEHPPPPTTDLTEPPPPPATGSAGPPPPPTTSSAEHPYPLATGFAETGDGPRTPRKKQFLWDFFAERSLHVPRRI